MSRERIVPLRDALARLGGISKSSYYRGVQAGEFPPLTKITKRRGGLLESQLDALIERAAQAGEARQA